MDEGERRIATDDELEQVRAVSATGLATPAPDPASLGDQRRSLVAARPSDEQLGTPTVMLPGYFTVGQAIQVSMTEAVREWWSWPGPGLVTGYETTMQRGLLGPPPGPVDMNPTIYFTQPGNYNFTSQAQYPDGSVHPFWWSFVISAPAGAVNAAFPGQANYYPNPDRIGLTGPAPNSPGITISGTAGNNTTADGYLAFIQLVQPSRFVGRQAGQPATPCPANARWILDANCSANLPFYNGQPVPLGRGTQQTLAISDWPQILLASFQQQLISAGVQNELFQTMLMFMPDPAPPAFGSIWIPLAQVNWRWFANAYRTDGGWVSFGTPGQESTPAAPTFPQWSETACPYPDWGRWAPGR